jgi:two-component system, OmpR family, sensor histidine kinase ArlS
MKLSNKINFLTTFLFIGLLIFINGAIYFSFSTMMMDRELERTASEAKKAIKGLSQQGTSIPIDDLLRAYVPINGMLQIVMSDGSQGPAVTAAGQQELRDHPVNLFPGEHRKVIHFSGIPHAFVSIPIVWNDGEIAQLQVTENLKTTSDMLGLLRLVLIGVTLFATIPVILSSRLLSHIITGPITSMISTMRDIQGSGHFKRIPLSKKSKDELYQMGVAFNHMIELLELNFEKQGQFISNASHELKTPLTVIESYSSLLKRRGKQQPELFDEAVEAIHSEALHMKNLTEQLLLLAKHDEQWNVDLEDLPLSLMAKDFVQSFQKAYFREIILQVDTELLVRTDKQKFKQLFYILLDNARKYSSDIINIHIYQSKQMAVVEINDYGIGIPSDELDKIFDRFYRVDKARARKTGGFGLGLSLAKEIAMVMHAEILLDSKDGQGTTAKIILPLAVTD